MSEAIISKSCSKCKIIKPIEEFSIDHHAKDGRTHQCKQCRNAHNRIYNRTDRGREKNKQYCSKYAKSPLGKSAMKRADSKRIYSNKRKAKASVGYAIKTGRLISPKKLRCSCGQPAQEYHHWSYEPEHWLDVIPKCIPCHKALHQRT